VTHHLPASLDEFLDRRTRDARIRELDREGWSLVQIGEAVGLSDERVRQILASKDPQLALLERELELHAEQADLIIRAEGIRRRLRAVRRELDIIAEERGAEHINRLLGLS